MSIFFVTIGANAGNVSALLQTGWLTAFIAIQLSIHLGFTVICGVLFKLPMQVAQWLRNAREDQCLGDLVIWMSRDLHRRPLLHNSGSSRVPG